MTEKMITKVVPFEVKEVAPRTLEFTGSTEGKDREGDIIMASGWKLKNFKKNPVFLWAHHYDQPPVGKAVKVWGEDGRLKFHVQFAERSVYEFADTIYQLYKGGFLKATSVGFMPLKSEPIEAKDEDALFHVPTRYLEQDLLELSGCPVPANPDALAEAKSKGLIPEVFANQLVEELEKEIEKTEDDDSKPYPNEHACRLKDPGDFDRFARKTCEQKHEGKCIDVIYGINEGKSEIQALRYKKDVWTASAAKSHCDSREGTFEAAGEEESEKQTYNCECIDCGYKMESDKHCNELKCPKCGGKMRREERPGPGQESADYVQMGEVKMFNQETIADDLEFLGAAIENEGLNDENMARAWELVCTIFECSEVRESGSDIPVEITEKIGAVLSKANREKLEKIKNLAQEILDSAEKEPEPDKSLTREEIIAEVSSSVKSAVEKAQGKIQSRR